MSLAAVAATMLLAWASVASSKPPVWTVTHGRATVVIFGSIHLLPPGLDWQPAELTAALAGADAVYFELPLNQATDAEAIRLRAGRGLLPLNDSLSAHLPPSVDAKLRRVAAGLGVSLQAWRECGRGWRMSRCRCSMTSAREAWLPKASSGRRRP